MEIAQSVDLGMIINTAVWAFAALIGFGIALFGGLWLMAITDGWFAPAAVLLAFAVFAGAQIAERLDWPF